MTFSILIFELTFQILIAESMFLYSYRRRNKFVIRVILSLLFCMAYSVFIFTLFPYYLYAGSSVIGVAMVQLAEFVRVITLIGITVIAAAICFKEDIWTLVAVCMAGYVVQHFAFKFGLIIELFIPMRKIFPNMYVYRIMTYIAYYVPVYIGAYFLFARPAIKHNYKNNSDKRLNLLSVTIILALIIINRILSFARTEVPTQIFASSLYGMLCCLLALFIQFSLYRYINLRSDYVTTQALLKQRAQQYDQWKASMEDINIRYHDLKHELDFIKEAGADSVHIDKVEQMLNNYSLIVHTGNEELDVLLAGKRLICSREGIAFSCMADGRALNAFDCMELYSLFNNALDNAIDSLKAVADKENRVMSMTVSRFGDAALISIENYFDGELVMKDGLPVSAKGDKWHGFGMKSMQRVVENYGGTMTVAVSDKMFRLEFILPYPSAAYNASEVAAG